jgi:hypothetical protein
MTRWSPEDDAILKDQLAKKKIVARVVVAGRSPKNIRRRAYRLKLIEVAGVRSQGSWHAIKLLIKETGMTVREIVEKTGFDTSSIANAIRTHRKEVHVSDYAVMKHARGRRAKVWRFGEGDDAVEQVVAMSSISGDDEFLDDVDPAIAMLAEAKKRLRKDEEGGRLIRRDELVEALYGRYVPISQSARPESHTN